MIAYSVIIILLISLGVISAYKGVCLMRENVWW